MAAGGRIGLAPTGTGHASDTLIDAGQLRAPDQTQQSETEESEWDEAERHHRTIPSQCQIAGDLIRCVASNQAEGAAQGRAAGIFNRGARARVAAQGVVSLTARR